MPEMNEQLTELISNSKAAFMNGQYHEAYNLAQVAINLVESYEVDMDINIAEELKNRPKSLADGWRFCKLQSAIRYREAGKFPVPDEKFDNDIQELVSILRQVK